MLTRRRNIEHSGPGPYAAALPPKNDFDIFSSLPISVRRPHIQFTVVFYLVYFNVAVFFFYHISS